MCEKREKERVQSNNEENRELDIKQVEKKTRA